MKEELLEKLDELSFSEFQFKWENAHRLSKKEVEFLLAVESLAIMHGKCLHKLTGGNRKKIEELIAEISAEEGIQVIETYAQKIGQ
jgi:hypothetical protein